MSTLMTQPITNRRSSRRPMLMLLFAVLILLIAIAVRLTLDWTTARRTTTVPQPAASATQNNAAPNQAMPNTPAQNAFAPDSIEQLQDKLRNNPENSDLYAQLGLAYLQKVRETADPTLYPKAQGALDNALKRNPQQLDALTGQGVLAAARHDFAAALVWSQKAQALNPYRAQILGIAVDAQVELGRYDEAVNTLQKMVDMRPDLASYTRVSYLRELYGDVDGAIQAMQTAVSMAQAGTEQWSWTQVQLGNLYFNRGDLAQAELIYRQVLQLRPDYAYAQAGLARVRAAQGNLTDAIATYDAVVKRLPLADMVITLGEWYAATGNQQAANQQYDLVNVIQQLNVSAGMNVDLELALFNANHGDKALAEKQARAVYGYRPTVLAADTLAWALYQNGKFAEAQTYSAKALKLNTQDAMIHFHAGMIAAALQNTASARKFLTQALTINPYFSVTYAPVARAKLNALR